MELSDPTAGLAALVALHRGLDRLGPGDAAFSISLLESLPALPPRPRIADLGCGTGATALLLARRFGVRVKAVDAVPEFLATLDARAAAAGLAALVEPIAADMGALNWPAGSLDLLWSEGAAYALGFARALECWRPLVARGGIAVVSELSWFVADPPREVFEYWRSAYPAVADEDTNAARARAADFEVLDVRRLPPQGWAQYYEPLAARFAAARQDPARATAVAECRREIDLYARYGDSYGYAFYVLRAR